MEQFTVTLDKLSMTFSATSPLAALQYALEEMRRKGHDCSKFQQMNVKRGEV